MLHGNRKAVASTHNSERAVLPVTMSRDPNHSQIVLGDPEIINRPPNRRINYHTIPPFSSKAYGKANPINDKASDMIWPRQKSHLIKEIESHREETLYRNFKPLGRPISKNTPDVDESFRFGVPSPPCEDIKSIIYPVGNEKDVEVPLKSSRHIKFSSPEQSGHSGQSSYQPVNNNLGIKETMYWKDLQERELSTKLVPRHLEKYRERNCRLVGTALTPLKETMAHLDKDYVFGVKIPPDDCTVGEILQHSPNKDSKEFLRDLIFNKGDDVGTKSTAFARFRNRNGKGEDDLSYISVSAASYHPRNINYQEKNVYQKRHALPKSIFRNDESSEGDMKGLLFHTTNRMSREFFEDFKQKKQREGWTKS